jgi:hypothetical protein
MSWVRASPAAVWEFIVGDDWPSAVGVVLALALTGLVAGLGVSAWWVMPIAVLLLLGLSILRAAREAGRTVKGSPWRGPPGGDPLAGTGRQAGKRGG